MVKHCERQWADDCHRVASEECDAEDVCLVGISGPRHKAMVSRALALSWAEERMLARTDERWESARNGEAAPGCVGEEARGRVMTGGKLRRLHVKRW